MGEQRSSRALFTSDSEQQNLSQTTMDHDSWYEDIQNPRFCGNLPEKHHGATRRAQSSEDKKYSPAGLTTLLHEEQDGNPAITLSAYVDGLPYRPAASNLPVSWILNDFAGTRFALYKGAPGDRKTMHKGEHSADESELSGDHSESRHTSAALQKLQTELEEHFEHLKIEYEHKRGIGWTPLRPWRRESWVWECDQEDIVEELLSVE